MQSEVIRANDAEDRVYVVRPVKRQWEGTALRETARRMRDERGGCGLHQKSTEGHWANHKERDQSMPKRRAKHIHNCTANDAAVVPTTSRAVVSPGLQILSRLPKICTARRNSKSGYASSCRTPRPAC